MHRRIFGIIAVAVLLLLGGTRQAEAQGLASLAAASGSSMAADKTGKCYSCDYLMGVGACKNGAGGEARGCVTNGGYGCTFSGGSCGTASLMEVDPDGGARAISSEGQLVARRETDSDIRRNCTGVIVARFQSPGDISEVRTRTGTLTL